MRLDNVAFVIVVLEVLALFQNLGLCYLAVDLMMANILSTLGSVSCIIYSGIGKSWERMKGGLGTS